MPNDSSGGTSDAAFAYRAAIHAVALQERERWRGLGTFEREQREREGREISAAIETRWGEGLALFDQMLGAAAGLLEQTLDRIRGAAEVMRPLTTALLALYSRAVEAAEEVRALVRAGFASGAEGRWRTLHELGVIARVLARHGDQLAESYLAHEAVGTLKAMQEHNHHCAAWSASPHPPESIGAARAEVDRLAERFRLKKGQFKAEYGWATGVAPAAGRRTGTSPDPNHVPTLRDLEAYVGLAALRPAYVLASHAVHADVRGLTAHPAQQDGPTRLLCAPSAEGIAQAVIQTGYSLHVVAEALVGHTGYSDHEVTLAVLGMVGQEMSRALQAAAGT